MIHNFVNIALCSYHENVRLCCSGASLFSDMSQVSEKRTALYSSPYPVLLFCYNNQKHVRYFVGLGIDYAHISNHTGKEATVHLVERDGKFAMFRPLDQETVPIMPA